MRVVFLMPTYYPDTFGGAERQARILARAMTRKGSTVTVLAPTMDRRAGGTVDEGGATVVRIPIRHQVFLGGRYLASMLAWWIKAFAWLARNRRAYDVIAIQHVKLHAAPGLLAGMLFGKALTGKIGRGGAHFELRRLPQQKLPFGRLVVALAKASRMAFVANSAEIADDLRACRIPDNRIVRIPNGVECPRMPLGTYRRPGQGPVYVYAGRLTEEKGVGALLDAFKAFVAAGHPGLLRVYGDGDLADQLAREAAESGGHIEFHGLTDDRSLIYGGAAFMILPSESEGMSNTLLEAMASGVVPIVTKVSGSGDLVLHRRTGFLLEASDPASIATAFEETSGLDEVEWREMSAAARRLMLGRHSAEAVADAYLALFARLGAARPAAAVGHRHLLPKSFRP